MDFREKVEYLDGYRRKMAKIDGLLMEREKWLAIGTKVSQDIRTEDSGHSSSEPTSRVEMAAIELSIIDSEIEKAAKRREEIGQVIKAGAKRSRYAELLEMRFVHGMSVYRIANILNRNERTIRRVIRKAIDKLDI